MAYSTPLTAVANASLTAAQWNASVRDNILETAVAKASAAGQHFVATGTNALAARTTDEDYVATENTRTITTYGSLATSGPQVTMTTGTKALVWFQTAMKSNTVAANTYCAVDITGATTTGADDNRSVTSSSAIADNYERCGAANLFSLTAGSNVFKLHFRVDSNTGTFRYRRLQAMGF